MIPESHDDRPATPSPRAETAALIGLSRTRSYIPELESLRGLAILQVLVFHLDGMLRPGLTADVSLPYAFVRGGLAGVDLFFVLSAFLLSLPFLAEAMGGPRVELRNYFARRALRILPAYWLAVVLGTALAASRPYDLLHGVPDLLFLNSFTHAVPIFPYGATWWSLATEVQFYLALPLLPILLRGRHGRAIGLVALGLYAVLYRAILAGGIFMGSMQGQLLLLRSVIFLAPVFLVGILAALLYLRHGARIRQALARVAWLRNGGADLVLAVVLLGLGRHLQNVAVFAATGQSTKYHGSHALSGVLFGLLLLLLLLAPLRTKRLLSNRVLDRLGVLSYSVYLMHVPFLWFTLGACMSRLPRVPPPGNLVTNGVGVLLALGCVACSEITYRFVERPFLVRKARLATARGT